MSVQNPNNPCIIGIDVSKSKLDIYITEYDEYQTIGNDSKSIRKFITKLKKYNIKPLLVMENTGGYEKLARSLFTKANYETHIAHSTRIHYFAKQKGYFAKTDKIDAKIIALYAQQECVKPTPVESQHAIELKELASRRCQLIELLTIEKCRIKPNLCKAITRSIKRIIKQIQTEIEYIDNAIAKLVMADEQLSSQVKRLQTFKGVGLKTANMLVCLLPELGRLSRGEIACLCGVAPRNKDSGIKTGRRMISGGRFHVRKALYMAAVCASTYNPTMRAYYRLLISKGKVAKVALTAIIRKIVITLNAMLRDQKDWCAEL